MPSREEVINFGAGPAGIPTPVAIEASKAFLNYEDTGIGLAEMSHRSAAATQIIDDCKAALREFLEIPEDYEVLFCHGGGSGQFSAVVYNLVPVWIEKRKKAVEKELGAQNEEAVIKRVKEDIQQYLRLDYLVTGSWSLKASQEAAERLGISGGKKFINVATDGRSANPGKFIDIPAEETWTLTNPSSNGGHASALTYYCDNETVDGVEFPKFPEILKSRNTSDESSIVACDMSSNILSRTIDCSQYGVIFAGAQKNLGITDTTLVIVRKSLINAIPDPSFLHAVDIPTAPTIMKYSIIAKNNSLYNTLPIFSVYVSLLVLRSLLTLPATPSSKTAEPSKVTTQTNLVSTKSDLIYSTLDAHPTVYHVVPKKYVRSRMNICFRIIKHSSSPLPPTTVNGNGTSADHNGRAGHANGNDTTKLSINVDEAAEKEFLSGAEKKLMMGLKGHRSVGGIRVSNYNSVTEVAVKKLVAWLEEFASGVEAKR